MWSLALEPDPFRTKLVRLLARRLFCNAIAKLLPRVMNKLPVFCFLLDVSSTGTVTLVELLDDTPLEIEDWLLLRANPFYKKRK
jgi:hypothetical protein